MDRGGASKGASAAWVSPLQGWGITAIRVIVGIVFVAHGGQKLLESGFSGFAGNLEGQGVPIPLFFAVLVILLEVGGGVALIFGLFTRLFAVPQAINMLMAALLVHSSRAPSASSARNLSWFLFPVCVLQRARITLAVSYSACLCR